MAARVMLSFADRVEIATGVKAGWGVRQVAQTIGRSAPVVSREIVRHLLADGSYKPVNTDPGPSGHADAPPGPR